MRNILFKKGLVIGIIILFIGMSIIIPPTGGIGKNQKSLLDNNMETLSEEISSGDNDTEYWALLIGVGKYAGHPEENRPMMLEDVANMREKLLVSEHWKDKNIKVIKGIRATLCNIIRGFHWLDRKEDENDISVVYIGTHGGSLNRDLWPRDEWDGKDEVLATFFGFMFPWARIRDDVLNLLLSFLESKGTCVIIDSCHSGGFNDTPYSKTIMNDNIMNADEWMHEFAGELSGSGRVVMMSCSEYELSQASIFTDCLIEGLTGYADYNEDDMVSAEEAFDYIVENLNDPYQHPTIYDDYIGELYLTQVEYPPSIPETPSGQILGDTNTAYYYSTVSTDPGGDKISYGWDWDGDYIVDEWTDLIDSNTTANTSHSWEVEGTYNIRVRAKDENGLDSDWSKLLCVMMSSDNIPDQWQKETDSSFSLSMWVAQSFIPSMDTLSKVDLLLNSEGGQNPLPLILYIRDNLTGENLAESSQTILQLESDQFNWYTFDFDNIDVIPGKTYYIVCKRIEGNYHYVWRTKKSDDYLNGEIFYSNDGEEWSNDAPFSDCCFVTWAVKT